MTSRIKTLPLLLYFYQNQLTQAQVETVEKHFDDKNVQFRRVFDINDTRDIVERCAYASGAVPIIYSLRKAEGVLTGGILPDPLGQDNAAKATSKGKDEEVVVKTETVLSTAPKVPTDAETAAELAKEEAALHVNKKEPVAVKPEDVVVDKQGSPVSTVTGQVPVAVAKPVEATPVAPKDNAKS